MRYILGVVLFWSSWIKADTATVDENMWSWGVAFPIEVTYISQKNRERAYYFPYWGVASFDTYIGYSDFELHLDWAKIDFRSDSLKNYSEYVGQTYGASLFYTLTRRVQAGVYMDKLSFISTSSSSYDKATLKGYGLKFIYNPNRVKEYNEKRTIQMYYTLAIGYVDGKESTSVSSDYKYINYRVQRVRTETHPDLSGKSVSLGVMLKY